MELSLETKASLEADIEAEVDKRVKDEDGLWCMCCGGTGKKKIRKDDK